MKFVRFGGVNTHKHKKQVKACSDYVVPPVSRGIFAFPLIGSIETYLVAWKYQNKLKMLLDRRTFDYHGLVWHHLGYTTGSFGYKGYWVLDPMDKYRKKLFSRLWTGEYQAVNNGIHYSNDDLEVFLTDKT